MSKNTLRIPVMGNQGLNNIDTMTNETGEFSNFQALSNAVAVLGTLQPWVFGLLIHLVPYVVSWSWHLNIKLTSHHLDSLNFTVIKYNAG